jgi:multidrug efflux pump subunit AcrA (membrane-fusion protein)
MAFVGNPYPKEGGGNRVISGHGALTVFTTLTSQSAKLISKAIDTLPNDEGQPVNRKHILFQVDSITTKFSKLDEAWTAIKNARNDLETVQLNDPDAYRLLMARKELDGLLKEFSTKPEVQSAKEALDDYVDAVQQRNAVLADYNTLVEEYIRVMGQINTTEHSGAPLSS